MTTNKKTLDLIKKNNHKWAKASSLEKRVLVAQDVLDQINSKKYLAASGEWVTAKAPFEKGSLQEQLCSVDSPICNCCALGSLMLSTTRYSNNVIVDDLSRFSRKYLCFVFKESPETIDSFTSTDVSASKQLKHLFDRRTLEKIEYCFECGDGAVQDELFDLPKSWKALSLSEKLIDIMQNIVDNKGKFSTQRLFKKYFELDKI